MLMALRVLQTASLAHQGAIAQSVASLAPQRVQHALLARIAQEAVRQPSPAQSASTAHWAPIFLSLVRQGAAATALVGLHLLVLVQPDGTVATRQLLRVVPYMRLFRTVLASQHVSEAP